MENNEQALNELITAFHLTWDNFPGVTRLIDKDNRVLATNKTAAAAGLLPDQICAKIGASESHRGCRKAVALRTGTAQVDRTVEGKIRAWLPVDGWSEVVVHFSLVLPETNNQ